MSTAELKLELINRITYTDDEELLNAIADLLKPSIYKMSENQINAVSEAEAEYKKGKFHSNEDLQKDMDEWLKD